MKKNIYIVFLVTHRLKNGDTFREIHVKSAPNCKHLLNLLVSENVNASGGYEKKTKEDSCEMEFFLKKESKKTKEEDLKKREEEISKKKEKEEEELKKKRRRRIKKKRRNI